MANRTIKMLGWGTGTASITAILNGETVFSGDVDLVEFTDENASEKTAPTLFTFDVPIDFGGSFPMKLTIGKSAVRFGQIIGNYTEVEFGEIFYTGPYEFADVSPIDSGGYRDPRNSVKIDGVARPVIDRMSMSGTWHYTINPGSTFEHDFRIKAGSELEF
jgi:hypothetical protein